MKLDKLIAQAKRHEKNGEFAEAIGLYTSILAKFPQNQRAQKGLEALRGRAFDPPVETLNELAALYHRGDLAAVTLRGAMLAKTYPHSATLWNILGSANKSLGRLDAAMENFRNAIAANPHDADAHNNLGVVLKAQNRKNDARAAFEKAIALSPTHAGARTNLGSLLRDQHRYDEALKHYGEAARVARDDPDLFYNIAGTHQMMGNADEAVTNFIRTLELSPGHGKARAYLLHQLAHLCDWQRFEMYSQELENLGLTTDAVDPFTTLALEDAPARQRQRSERWVERYTASEPLPSPFVCGGSSRIRVGCFSADFHSHATMCLMSQVFAHHDRDAFDILLYSFGTETDEKITADLKKSVTRFDDVRALTDREIAERARADGLDIAVDLKGFTKNSRPGIFFHRAAPIQISYLGYPATMGAPAIDYLVADPVIVPPDLEKHYSEAIIRLPHTYQATDDTRAIPDTSLTREEFGLPSSGFVFCCFNGTYKITPREFTIWMRLLQRVEGSCLWLLRSHPQAEGNLKQAAARFGVDPDRIIFAEKTDHASHLARQRLADLFLDTFVVNAHTTASDALWAGLPVLSRIGEQFAARVAASVLTAIGLPELITTSDEAYEQLALEIARDREKHTTLREKLARNRLTTPLFQSERYTRNLERAYRLVHERHVTGLAPQALSAGEDSTDENRLRLAAG